MDLLIKYIQVFDPVKLIPGFMNIPPDKRGFRHLVVEILD